MHRLIHKLKDVVMDLDAKNDIIIRPMSYINGNYAFGYYLDIPHPFSQFLMMRTLIETSINEYRE